MSPSLIDHALDQQRRPQTTQQSWRAKMPKKTPANDLERQAIQAFASLCHAQDGLPSEEQVDPNDAHDWKSLTMGFFLGKGFSSRDAERLVSHIRYTLGIE
jgi:hypothetical protein